MIRLLALALILLGAEGAWAQGAPAGALDSIRALDRAWAHAYAVHDTAFAESLFADDLVVTSSSGQLKDRTGELSDVRPTPDLAMEFFRTGDVVLRLRRETAVVTGVAEWAFRWKGRRSSLRRRYTAVYVRGGPLGWQMLALQLGPVPDDTTAGRG